MKKTSCRFRPRATRFQGTGNGFRALIVKLGCVVLLSLLASCNSKRNANPATFVYQGSPYLTTLTLGPAGAFTYTEAADASSAATLTITGTYIRKVRLGFVKFTVSDGSGNGAPGAGVTSFGVEIPGLGIFFKPFQNDTRLVPLIVSSSVAGCPLTGFNGNWINAADTTGIRNANSATVDMFGTFGFNMNSGTVSLGSRFALPGFAALGLSTIAGSGLCEAGRLDLAGGHFFLSPGGMALGQIGTNSLLVTPTDILSTTQSFVEAFDGEYAGILFNNSRASGQTDRLMPVISTLSSASIVANHFGIDTGEIDTTRSVTFDINSVDSPSIGFAEGTVRIGALHGTMVCSSAKSVGTAKKKALFCVGQAPQNNVKQFNLVLLSYDKDNPSIKAEEEELLALPNSI